MWLEKIVQVSGLIDLLENGDHFMVDRGLNIRDLFTRRGVKLNIPPFSKGRFSNSTYHTNKKAKEELSLFSNPEPLSPPPQTQATTLFTFPAANGQHYLLHLFVILPFFNFLHLSFLLLLFHRETAV